MNNLKFKADAEESTDGREASECKYCHKSKHPPQMSSRYICRVCSNSAQKKTQAKLRAARREDRDARASAKIYPLSQSWSNLAFVVTA